MNIGVEYGASVVCLNEGAPHSAIFAVDIDISKQKSGDIAHYVQTDSWWFALTWRDLIRAPIDMLFIDGDHSYEGVVHDSGLAWFVRSGGVVAFHDCYDWPPAPPKTVHSVVPGVNRAVSEWAIGFKDYFSELEPVDSMRIFKRTEKMNG